jgi:hypothetical protein
VMAVAAPHLQEPIVLIAPRATKIWVLVMKSTSAAS